MMDITAVGEVLIDLTQNGVNEQGIPQFAANPGGAPANLAVAAARLGAKTAFVGKVGRDSFGDQLRKCLQDNNVDVSAMCVDPVQHTTLAVVSLDPTGERHFSFYRDPSADVSLTSEEIPLDMLQNTKYLHFGSVSLTADPARTATLYAAKARMKEALPLADVLKVSDEELPLLTGTTDLEEGTAILAAQGISLVLVTMGPDGAFYRFQGKTGHVAGVPCKVGDTNGAGDTFFGAVLSQLSQLNSLQDLTIPELERVVALANKAASITTSRHGAIPAMPTMAEVQG